LAKLLANHGRNRFANKDTIKKNVKSKFKEKMWCDKELEEKRKLRYYKDVINPNLEDQNYLSVFPSVKKKISIAKIRTNSHELHNEIDGQFVFHF
jgi:hypothetical protein